MTSGFFIYRPTIFNNTSISTIIFIKMICIEITKNNKNITKSVNKTQIKLNFIGDIVTIDVVEGVYHF